MQKDAGRPFQSFKVESFRTNQLARGPQNSVRDAKDTWQSRKFRPVKKTLMDLKAV